MAASNPLKSRLRNKIVIEKATTSRGAAGSVVPSWATFATRRAEIRHLSGNEVFNAQQEQNEYKIRFIVRYDSLTKLVDPRDYRITYNGNTYDITAVSNIKEMNREIEIITRLHNG